MEVNLKWKNKDKSYLRAIEIFLDKASNIQNENLEIGQKIIIPNI